MKKGGDLSLRPDVMKNSRDSWIRVEEGSIQIEYQVRTRGRPRKIELNKESEKRKNPDQEAKIS